MPSPPLHRPSDGLVIPLRPSLPWKCIPFLLHLHHSRPHRPPQTLFQHLQLSRLLALVLHLSTPAACLCAYTRWLSCQKNPHDGALVLTQSCSSLKHTVSSIRCSHTPNPPSPIPSGVVPNVTGFPHPPALPRPAQK